MSIGTVANRSFGTEKEIIEKKTRLRLAPTEQVIGDFETPVGLKGNHPDSVLMGEARILLKYRTNITLLEWWERFPVGKWWRYAIMATKALARKANYRYFLKCLLTAARGGAQFDAFYQYLQRFYKGLMDKVKGDPEPPPLCSCESICEKCFELKGKYYRPYLEGARDLAVGLKPGLVGTG